MQIGVISKIHKVLGSVIQKLSNIKFDNPNTVLICDVLIASISLLLSIQLRIGLDFFSNSYLLLFNNILVFGLVSASISNWIKINNFSLDNINKVILVVLISNITFIPFMYWMCWNSDLPLAILIINIFIMSFLLISIRFIYNNFFKPKVYTLLIGNNESIVLFLNLYKDTIINNLKNIGIINTNPETNIDKRIAIPIMGNISELSDIIKVINVNQIIITNNELHTDYKEILFILSQQNKFMLLQICNMYD